MPALFDFTDVNVSGWLYQLLTLSGKGIVILGLTGLVAYSLRASSAAIRYLVWCAGVLSLMLLPLFSSALPGWEVGILPGQTTAESFSYAPTPVLADADWAEPVPAPLPDRAVEPRADSPVVASASAPWYASLNGIHWTTWVFGIWCLGAIIILTRLLIAHIGAKMLVRRGELVHDDDWHLLAEEVQTKLGIAHMVRLRYSSWTTVPMSVGIFRSYVVLPVTADTWEEEERRTVMVHEMAHIKRKDCLLHLLTQVASALYWLNPLVWVAAWRLRVERERACDDMVLQYGINPSHYAETLLQTARSMRRAEWSTVAGVSMARHSQLEGRLLSILDPMQKRTLGRYGTILALGLVASVAVPLALLKPVQAQEVPQDTTAKAAIAPSWDVDVDIPEIVIPELDIDIPEIVIPEMNIEIPSMDIHVPEIEIPEMNFTFQDAEFDNNANWGEAGSVKTDSLTIEQIITLKKYGIDAEFIRALKDMGYETITYRELLTLGKYGVDADYIGEMERAGYPGFSLLDYAHMRKYGVDADFVAEMNEVGYDDLSAEDMINMSKYGVDEDMVALMVEYGYDDMSVEEIISVSKYGVDEDLIISLNEAGYRNLSIDELIGMSRYGVDEDLIISLADNGYTNLSSNDLINASKYGLDEDLIVSLGNAGYSNLAINDVISMSKYGVDEDLIAVLGEYGYTNLTAEELINASKYGVDEELIVALNENGFQKVNIDDIIQMTKYGVDEELIVEMADADFDVSVDELIRLQKYGVDAEYIRVMMDTGFEDITIDQIIEMKKHGVDPEYVKELKGQ